MLAPTPCYSRNLEALRAFQPEVAAAVDAAPVCEGVAQTTARDGSNTYLIPGEGGRPIWFGASSMPTISASEIFADFYSDGRSVWLPGVFTGVEPLVVVGRMPPHAALFVVERNLSHVKLAMHLHDYVELLAAGRLVFIPGDGEELVEIHRLGDVAVLVDGLGMFLEHHPGYELPVHLLSGPQLSAVQVADLGCRLETAGRAAAAVQAPIVEAHVQRIRARSFAQLSSSPRVAVLSVDPGPVSLEQAGRIGRALTALGWSHELCIPNAPDKCHIAARLQTIERLSADLVLFVNGTAGPMNPLLPEDLPVACW
ncbi:MAG: hypothetical protein IH897_15625, partial [Planctomycetes bacterium]|nr:hypothetical protein [Planctomycetota bacterium]